MGEVFRALILQKRILGGFGPYMAELFAIRLGLIFAVDGVLQVGIIESDAQNVVLAIQRNEILSAEGFVVEDIKNLMSMWVVFFL